MSALSARVAEEPVALGAALLAVVEAVIGTLLVAGTVSTEVAGALQGVAIAVTGLIAFLVRSRVTPVPPEERGW